MTDNTVWVLRLPYEKPPLNLNDRPAHWSITAAKKREIRAVIRLLCIKNGVKKCETIHVQLEYTPKTNRNRDADNLIATQKPAIDGLIDAEIVPDDTPKYVTWSAPKIAPADKQDPHLTLTITGKETA